MLIDVSSLPVYWEVGTYPNKFWLFDELYTHNYQTSHGDQLMPHRGAEVSILKFALVPGSENLGTAINICALLF